MRPPCSLCPAPSGNTAYPSCPTTDLSDHDFTVRLGLGISEIHSTRVPGRMVDCHLILEPVNTNNMALQAVLWPEPRRRSGVGIQRDPICELSLMSPPSLPLPRSDLGISLQKMQCARSHVSNHLPLFSLAKHYSSAQPAFSAPSDLPWHSDCGRLRRKPIGKVYPAIHIAARLKSGLIGGAF